jgi:membrane-associated phospholipid phosphatase
MTPLIATLSEAGRTGWRDEIGKLDTALYSAIAATPTPTLDRYFRALSRAADHSKLWIGTAAALAAAGGRPGRRAAVNGLASVAVTSAVVNLLLKPLSRRRRPDRCTNEVAGSRHVAMPRSTSFPSGHAASAFAFATGVGIALPRSGLPLTATAALVAYSRVHTGVHYPSDAVAGSVIGAGLAPAVVTALDHRRAMQTERETRPPF